ncbi:MAG: YifB family Mg chelatase-like AAA ATPase [Firmicutes bacterium]|nr:YifB family Mg chelatase-like AAA ATPase [Bacillota bacterium]
MYSRVLTGSLYGLSGEKTWAEVDSDNGLPAFNIVGLANQSIREAKERIRSAMENSGFKFPARRITVNLTPAGRRKGGSHYDLAIAAGLLICSGLDIDSKALEELENGETAFLGELTLDGRINAVDGALPLVIGLRDRGVRSVVLPEGNLREAMLVKGMELFPAPDLKACAMHLSGFERLEKHVGCGASGEYRDRDIPDFSDIKGQESIKRAAQLAACGMHGMLMMGPPGVGKSMVGRRIPGLLPPLSYEEQLEVTQIYSVAGELSEEKPLITERPFRAPHHSISASALVGGGPAARPGEVSLAHCGILFLDELPEFNSAALQSLRTPLEEGSVSINRVGARVVYPARFMLVAAMNPCRCGYYGDPVKECSCTETDRKRYIGRISGPLLDRIDLHVSLERLIYEEVSVGSDAPGSSTADLKEGVAAAMSIQQERYKDETIRFNSQLTAPMIEKYCRTDRTGGELLKAAYERFDLSARAYHRILKLARTAADLDGGGDIKEKHVLEALRYRFPEDLMK